MTDRNRHIDELLSDADDRRVARFGLAAESAALGCLMQDHCGCARRDRGCPHAYSVSEPLAETLLHLTGPHGRADA